MHTEWATTRPPGQVPRSPPSLSTGEDRGQGTGAAPPRGPGSTAPPSHSEARAGPPATGQVLRSPPMLPTGKGQGTLESAPLAPGTYPGTSKAAAPTTPPPSLVSRPSALALDLALSGKGPRPVHPANWRRVLDVESRPSDTCDARGRSLEVSPPPSARRCRGTLMGRCVLHKSSQGSG